MLVDKQTYFEIHLPAFNLLNSGVVIYLSWLEILILTSLVYIFKTVVVTKLLVSGILFSIFLNFVFKTAGVTKPFVSEILLPTSSIFFVNFVHLCCIDLCELM